MMAPRPMLLVSATRDWTKNVPSEEFPAVRDIYALHGAGERVEVVQIDAPHNYNRASREAVYQFFAKHLLGAAATGMIEERKPASENLQDLIVFHAQPLPANALGLRGLFTRWKAMSREQAKATTDHEELRDRLGLAFHASWPGEVRSEIQGDAIVLSRAGFEDRVPGIYVDGDGLAALVIHPAGAAAARRDSVVAERVRDGRPVLMIDAFQTGDAIDPRNQDLKHFLAFNLTDDANRVQDILTALAFLSQRHEGVIELVGLEDAAVWSLFAAALAPHPVRLSAEVTGFKGADQDFAERYFVPGLQRAGGLEAALRLTEQ